MNTLQDQINEEQKVFGAISDGIKSSADLIAQPLNIVYELAKIGYRIAPTAEVGWGIDLNRKIGSNVEGRTV